MCVPRNARYISLVPSHGLRGTVVGKDVGKECGDGARESLSSSRGPLCIKNRDCGSFALLE